MSSKYGRNEVARWQDQGPRYRLSEDPEFEETNPNGEPRDVYVLKRPLNRFAPQIEKYRTVRNTLEKFDSFGGPVKKIERGLEPAKQLFLHSGFLVGDKTWDAYEEGGSLRPRAKRWGSDELGNCRSKELYARGVTFTDKEINEIYEDGIDRLNSQGGYNPVFRDCNHATRKGLKNLSAEAERLKRFDRGKQIDYYPSRSQTWSPDNYPVEVVNRDRRIERYYSDEQTYTRRTFKTDYDVPEFQRRRTS